MSDTLRVQWTIVPQMAPQPWLNCNRCGGIKRFRSSEKIRVNANGKRVDAWLIYKCTSCDSTWNRPILERRHVRTIDPLFLMSLRTNEPRLARRLAFDAEDLRRRASHVEELDDVVVLKDVLSESIMPIRRLEILCTVPKPTPCRSRQGFAWIGFWRPNCTCRGAGSRAWRGRENSSCSMRDRSCCARRCVMDCA